MVPGRAPIIRRLDAALAKMHGQGMEVRAIYLTESDWDEYNDAQSKAIGSKCVCFLYGDFQIRSGGRSIIYSKQGVGVHVPKAVPGE